MKMRGFGDNNGDGDEDRVIEWEAGLPNLDDITPLHQLLISPELASAFSISPEPTRTVHDVNRASQTTLTSLRGGVNDNECAASATALPLLHGLTSNYNKKDNSDKRFKSFAEGRGHMLMEEAEMEEEDEEDRVGSGCGGGGGGGGGSDSKKSRTDGSAEEAESAAMRTTEDDPSSKTLKRPRLVWTPQLHKRFVDVVGHLGIKNAVPKTIMQLMNVEGLTRENVASHLQKYRLYLKRMQGLSNEGPSSSDHLFASTPVPPQSFLEGGGDRERNGGHMMPVPYAAPMMPMPLYGGHMGMQIGGSQGPMGYHNQHHSHDGYRHHHGGSSSGGFKSNPYMIQQRDWSGNKYGSVASYAPVGGGSNRED